VVRHKSLSHQLFHLLPRPYWPLSTPPSTNHILIPPNQCVIREYNDYQFYFLRLRIVMAIKNPIHLFLPLQICLGIVFTLKGRYFQFDSIQITMSPTTTEISPLTELTPSSIPKIPLVSRLLKTFPMAYGLVLKTTITNIINILLKILIISLAWPFGPTATVCVRFSPNLSSHLGCLYQPRYHVSPPYQVCHTRSPS
jgi:hypothetical protein